MSLPVACAPLQGVHYLAELSSTWLSGRLLTSTFSKQRISSKSYWLVAQYLHFQGFDSSGCIISFRSNFQLFVSVLEISVSVSAVTKTISAGSLSVTPNTATVWCEPILTERQVMLLTLNVASPEGFTLARMKCILASYGFCYLSLWVKLGSTSVLEFAVSLVNVPQFVIIAPISLYHFASNRFFF